VFNGTCSTIRLYRALFHYKKPLAYLCCDDLQVSNLRHEREEIVARQLQDATADSSHVRAVQRENVQLNVKVKSLLSELEEIRSQREHAGMQADSVTRLQVKQMAELSASIKALEVQNLSIWNKCG